MEHINWYPGHMKKTKELIQENLKLTNVAIEIIDARIPISSRNPIFDELIKNKIRVIILNKSDLADLNANRLWINCFKSQGAEVVAMNCVSGAGMSDLLRVFAGIQVKINEGRVRKKPLRAMIIGIPNVGKSSLINRLAGKRSAKTGNKPGVTRGKQWINIQDGVQLLDTPGILWPKFEDPTVGLMLSFIGSIKDEILDREELALELIKLLSAEYPTLLMERYKLEKLGEHPLGIMEEICLKRGFILAGKKFDYARCARTIVDEFRSGKMGRFTLERPQ